MKDLLWNEAVRAEQWSRWSTETTWSPPPSSWKSPQQLLNDKRPLKTLPCFCKPVCSHLCVSLDVVSLCRTDCVTSVCKRVQIRDDNVTCYNNPKNSKLWMEVVQTGAVLDLVELREQNADCACEFVVGSSRGGPGDCSLTNPLSTTAIFTSTKWRRSHWCQHCRHVTLVVSSFTRKRNKVPLVTHWKASPHQLVFSDHFCSSERRNSCISITVLC